VVPDREALCIALEVRCEPVGGYEEFSAAFRIGGLAEEIVVSHGVLRDRDGVVLQADFAVIVELRNAGGIVGTLIVGLLGELHVVFAEFAGRCIRIFCGSFMPEGQVTFAA
jgi:hypothetical protein